MVQRQFRFSVVGAGILLGLAVLVPQKAMADTDVTVNDTRDLQDPSPGHGVCSSTANTCTLRAAIQRANHHLTGTHTIRLPAGTFRITIAGRGEDDAEFGDFDIKENIVIRGAGARLTIIDAASLDRVFDVRRGSLTLVDVAVRGGFTGGNDTDGGGIRAKANLTLSRVHLHSNTSAGSGGGIWTEDDLSIVGSTIANNSSPIDNGAVIADHGGVITKSISIRESTFSGNTGSSGGASNKRGALSIRFNYDVEILHSTFANNSPGGISVLTSASNNQLTIQHTLLADNIPQGMNCEAFTGYTNPVLTNNLDSDGSCGFSVSTTSGNLVLVDPMLGPLQNNGGQTPTIAFANPQVAEKGTFAGALCSGVDQRGLPRPVVFSSGASGGRCDIGSIELQGPVGIAALDPDNATIKKGETLHLNYLWRVPPGENWHDIKSLDLRIRDGDDTLIWLRWTEGPDSFQLINPRNGKPHGAVVFAGSGGILETDDAELDAKESSSQGSGPTGPEVTLHLALSFHKKSGPHGSFTIEVNAADDHGQTQSFVALGAVTVR